MGMGRGARSPQEALNAHAWAAEGGEEGGAAGPPADVQPCEARPLTSLFQIPEAGMRMAIHPAIHPQAVGSFHLPSPKSNPCMSQALFPSVAAGRTLAGPGGPAPLRPSGGRPQPRPPTGQLLPLRGPLTLLHRDPASTEAPLGALALVASHLGRRGTHGGSPVNVCRPTNELIHTPRRPRLGGELLPACGIKPDRKPRASACAALPAHPHVPKRLSISSPQPSLVRCPALQAEPQHPPG